jgi:hypothetical protein
MLRYPKTPGQLFKKVLAFEDRVAGPVSETWLSKIAVICVESEGNEWFIFADGSMEQITEVKVQASLQMSDKVFDRLVECVWKNADKPQRVHFAGKRTTKQYLLPAFRQKPAFCPCVPLLPDEDAKFSDKIANVLLVLQTLCEE